MIDSARFGPEEWQAWHAGFMAMECTLPEFSAQWRVTNTQQLVSAAFATLGSYTARTDMSGNGALCDTVVLISIGVGTVRLVTDDTQAQGAAGDILVFGTGMPLTFHARDLAGGMVCIPRKAIDRSAPQVMPRSRILTGTQEAVRLLSNTVDDVAAKEIGDSGGRNDAAEMILACLKIAGRGSTGHITEGGSDTSGLGTDTRSELIRLVDANLGNPGLTADWIANQLEVSRASLYRQFAAHGGMASIIRARRLDHAFADIAGRKGRRENLDAVAARYGFSNRSVFSRAFTKRFGASPISIAKAFPDPGRTAAKIARTLGGEGEANLYSWMLKNTMRALLERKTGA